MIDCRSSLPILLQKPTQVHPHAVRKTKAETQDDGPSDSLQASRSRDLDEAKKLGDWLTGLRTRPSAALTREALAQIAGLSPTGAGLHCGLCVLGLLLAGGVHGYMPTTFTPAHQRPEPTTTTPTMTWNLAGGGSVEGNGR